VYELRQSIQILKEKQRCAELALCRLQKTRSRLQCEIDGKVSGRCSRCALRMKAKVARTRLPSVGSAELIPVLGSQPARGVSHKPGGRLPLLSARPAVTPATLKRVAISFAAGRTEARWV